MVRPLMGDGSSSRISTPPDAARPRIVFVTVEDWFFASHFLPMVAAARAAGLEPVVVTHVGRHGPAIEASGARLVPLDVDRTRRGVFALLAEAGRLRAILRRERPAILHCISLRSIVQGGLAARGLPRNVSPRGVFAVTGLGHLGVRLAHRPRAAHAFGWTLRRLVAGPDAHFLLENPSDADRLGLPRDGGRVTLVGGAGIDPARHPAHPLPPAPPLRVAIVARMVHSKGVEVAVEAVRTVHERGVPIALSLYGAPDPLNPRPIPEETLRAWSRHPAITWHGPTKDVDAVWQTHHAALVPSLGGEGLPRSLLEAAAAGRAILTTRTPGNADFVRDGVEGFVTAPGDAKALADALVHLAEHPETLAEMGRAARARVLDGYTIADVEAVMRDLYRRLL